MKQQRAIWAGKEGYYTIEFYDQEDGTVLAKAVGPVPFEGGGWVSDVASATGKTKDDAHRLVVEKLKQIGA